MISQKAFLILVSITELKHSQDPQKELKTAHLWEDYREELAKQ